MRGSDHAFILITSLFFLAAVPAAASQETAPIPVSQAPAPLEPVASWDPSSPQQLVRVEGKLYQQDSGLLFPVIEDIITVGLVEGVRDWDELLQRAAATAPAGIGAFSELTPLRTNRLGIVDLRIPEGSPAEWAEWVYESGLVRFAEVATHGVWLVTPNDPLYSQQWALNNTGQTGGTPGADMDAEAAWDITAGDPSIIVAVLDSGTLVTHPDLAPNVWHNPGEIPSNGVDDDGNGYVDDVDGWDFGNNNNNVTSGNFHGTHVTGVVNARGGNGIGIVGLAGGVGGPGVLSMAEAVGEGGPDGSILDDAILYAVDNGAHVITMSLTVGSSSAINNALDEAYNDNDLFINCAAGNNGSSVSYPANRPEVVAVASTDHHDNRSSFSNPGPELELAAPGSNILSTQLGNSYNTSSGTSFSSPYVAALAGLVRSVNPGLSAPEVRQLLIDTADDIGSPGFDNQTGWGRINARAALEGAGSSDGMIELDADVYACSDRLVVTTTDFDLAGVGSITVDVRSGLETGGEIVLLTETGNGIFSGTIDLDGGSATPDGLLQVAHDDTITAEYLDADDGQGGFGVLKTDTALVDCAGPGIGDVATQGIDDASASIFWITNEPGTGVVRFGETLPLDREVSSAALTVSHLLPLGELDSCTNYRFEVESADLLGNVTVDDNAGALYSFQTLGVIPGGGVGPCQLGLPLLDRAAYGCSSSVLVSVIDIDLNVDPGIADTVGVLMTSSSETAGEWITLTETGVDTGTFSGSITLTPGGPAADGMLSASADDLITVTYFDEDDGQGQSRVASYVSTADCTGPSISDIRVTAISATRAEVTWTTDEPATSRVEFGSGVLLGSVAESLELTTSHNVAISALEACDRGYLRVSSTDEFGDQRTADAGGQPFEFNQNRIGGLVFHDNFETDLGWTLPGEWERGAPAGAGSHSGDPDEAYSGASVLGNDLSGSGSFPGDYEPGMSETAYTPSLNTLGRNDLELILRRKLGVADGGNARILVIGSFFPNQVWSNAGAVDDADWLEMRYDIDDANNQASVKIGFVMAAGTGGPSYGWNIDEIIVKDSNAPDYLACGDCTGAPGFAGLATVKDPEPCAASGLNLNWATTAAWGTGTAGTYEVYRGTTDDFTPDAGNLIASGLTGTSWNDATAPVDTPVWYVVRARNDEDCSGTGLVDDNLVRLAAIETTSRPLPTEVDDSLVLMPVGFAHVRLSWDPATGADHYVLRRSTSPDFSSAVEIGATEATSFEDVNVASDGNLYFYRVFSTNACGDEAP